MEQVTVVTGGSRGIGAAVAVRLGAAGHRVAVGYERSKDAAEDVARQIREAGGRCLVHQVDTSDEQQVDALFDAVRDGLGPVTGLVNNAGVTGPLGRFAETPVDVMRRVVDVNVMGALICARRAVLEMSTRYGGAGGAIVNISSGGATLGSPGEYVHYAASKAAVDTMTLGLSKELGPDGVRVNSVQPGMIVTDITRPWATPSGRGATRTGSRCAGPGSPRRSRTRWCGCCRPRRRTPPARCSGCPAASDRGSFASRVLT